MIFFCSGQTISEVKWRHKSAAKIQKKKAETAGNLAEQKESSLLGMSYEHCFMQRNKHNVDNLYLAFFPFGKKEFLLLIIATALIRSKLYQYFQYSLCK
jgi:hypothetical protein